MNKKIVNKEKFDHTDMINILEKIGVDKHIAKRNLFLMSSDEFNEWIETLNIVNSLPLKTDVKPKKLIKI